MGVDFDDFDFEFDEDHGKTTFIIIACCMVAVFIAIVVTVFICKRKGKCGAKPIYQSKLNFHNYTKVLLIDAGAFWGFIY